MKKLFEKYPVLRYIVESFVKFFLCSLVVFTLIFGVLEFTGIYAWLERALNLKYNSPFVLAPLFGFAILTVLCLVIGIILYFYKYKRPKLRSTFYKAFSCILNETQTDD